MAATDRLKPSWRAEMAATPNTVLFQSTGRPAVSAQALGGAGQSARSVHGHRTANAGPGIRAAG
ncbi:MAG: hypothetical protein AAFQ84_11060 [Pseudomonadota bacterium]